MSELVQTNEIHAGAQLRSGTAARLAGLPVTTLRVWERRYSVVAAPKTVTGQRLYSAHDVQRLRLLKQLTDHGHAISTVATLALESLQMLLAAEPPAAFAQASPASTLPAGAGHVVVVGRGAAQRLNVDGLPWALVVFDDMDQAEQQLPGGQTTATLLVQLPSLQPMAADKVLALAAALRARSVIVTYAFGAETVAAVLRAAGVVLRREPVSGAELRRLISSGLAALGPAGGLGEPRRFSDEALAELAEMPSPVACECPRHVAEIVMQLVGFERYSAECSNRSPDDAALHRHLNQLAGTARSLFEEALARVVAEEGLVLTRG